MAMNQAKARAHKRQDPARFVAYCIASLRVLGALNKGIHAYKLRKRSTRRRNKEQNKESNQRATIKAQKPYTNTTSPRRASLLSVAGEDHTDLTVIFEKAKTISTQIAALSPAAPTLMQHRCFSAGTCSG